MISSLNNFFGDYFNIIYIYIYYMNMALFGGLSFWARIEPVLGLMAWLMKQAEFKLLELLIQFEHYKQVWDKFEQSFEHHVSLAKLSYNIQYSASLNYKPTFKEVPFELEFIKDFFCVCTWSCLSCSLCLFPPVHFFCANFLSISLYTRIICPGLWLQVIFCIDILKQTWSLRFLHSSNMM